MPLIENTMNDEMMNAQHVTTANGVTFPISRRNMNPAGDEDSEVSVGNCFILYKSVNIHLTNAFLLKLARFVAVDFT